MTWTTQITAIKTWTYFLVGLSTIIIYTALLILIRRKGENKWITQNMLLIMLGNFGLIMNAYGFYLMFYKGYRYSIFAIWMVGLGTGIADGGIAIAHYQLAVKYNKIANEVPAAINGEELEPQSRC